MKNKDALKLFFSDNAFICLIVFLTQFFFFGILFMVKGIWFEEIFYFTFLVFFMLTLFILIRFYKVGRVYEKLLLKSKLLNDYIIEEPRSDFEKNYNLMIDEIIKISSDKEVAQKQDKKIQKLMIYRFVHQMKTPLSVLKLIYENNGDKDDYKRIGRNINTLEYNLNQILNIYKLDDFKNDFVSEKVFLKNLPELKSFEYWQENTYFYLLPSCQLLPDSFDKFWRDFVDNMHKSGFTLKTVQAFLYSAKNL